MTNDDSLLQRELRQKRPFRSRAQEAAVSILRTADVVRRRMAAAIEPSGVTLQQYNVLRILRGQHPGPLPTLEIGERLIEQVPGTTRLLDRLVEKGLVRRERCADDRRMVYCWITADGLDLLAALDDVVDAVDDAVVAGLSDGQQQLLIESLEQVRKTNSGAGQG